jgi:hypothetical protein
VSHTLIATCVASAVVAVVAVQAQASAFDDAWSRVASGTTGGISGLAPSDSGWVIVRDNKLAGQNRVALLDDAGAVTPLSWPGSAPQDLESLAAVPGVPGQYATLTSTGSGFVFTIQGATMSVVRSFVVPKGTRNIESFALVEADTATLAVWATRGSSTVPAKVFAATFIASTGAFGAVVTGRVTVPYPTIDVRYIADLAIVGGRLIGSATSDPGASGPFGSALYDLGSVSLSAGRAALTIEPPARLATYDGHKVEGVACRGAVGLLGADDEKLGGWARSTPICA